jgi:hypothetical protein
MKFTFTLLMVIADQSSSNLEMGEGSIALAKALGINASPRTGGVDDGVAYVIYPRSGNGKPRPLKEISAISQRPFQAWGGTRRLKALLRSQPSEAASRSESDLP